MWKILFALSVGFLLVGCGDTGHSPTLSSTSSTPTLAALPSQTIRAGATPTGDRVTRVAIYRTPNESTRTIVGISTPGVTYPSDCGGTFIASTWLDRDENGQWDNGEPPLAGVVVILTAYGMSRSTPRTTGADGTIRVVATMASCPLSDVQVTAETPNGYRRTTPATLNGAFAPLQWGFTNSP